jgi:ABC-type amino acid transport system permease subunit
MIIAYSALSLLYLLFFVNMKYPRYFIPVLPFLVIIGYGGLKWLGNLGKKVHLNHILAVLLAVSVITAAYASFSYISINGPGNLCKFLKRSQFFVI